MWLELKRLEKEETAKMSPDELRLHKKKKILSLMEEMRDNVSGDQGHHSAEFDSLADEWDQR